VLLNEVQYLDENIREVDIIRKLNSVLDSYSYLEYLILDRVTPLKFNQYLKFNLLKILFCSIFFSIIHKYLFSVDKTCVSLNILRTFSI